MHYFTTIFVVVAMVTIASGQLVPKSTFATNIDFSAVIAAHDRDQNFTGSVLVVGDRSGNLLVHAKSPGNVTYNTFLPIASASKLLSASVILKFIQDGKLSLTDKPQKFITWWTTDPSDGRANITISHLLSFTSGFIGDVNRLNISNPSDCISNFTSPFEQCAQYIYNNCFVFGQPGTTYDYGSTHLFILALIAMKIDGATQWNRVGQNTINTPFGLSTLNTWGRNPAGGANFSTESVEVILRELYLKNQTIFFDSSEVDMTPSSTIYMSYTPFPGWHYGLGRWLECNRPSFDQSCIDRKVISACGGFGYYPWIDRVNDYYAILGRSKYDMSGQAAGLSIGLAAQLRPLIIAALQSARGGSTQPSSTASVAPTSEAVNSPIVEFPPSGTPSSSSQSTSPSTSSFSPSQDTVLASPTLQAGPRSDSMNISPQFLLTAAALTYCMI